MKKTPALVALSFLLLAFQPGSAQKTNPKVEAFFRTAEQAKSLGPLAEWFSKQKYTDAEKRTLANRVKDSPLGKKLQGLYDKEVKVVSRNASARANLQVQKAKIKMAQERKQRMADYRSRAASLFGTGKKPPTRVTFRSLPSTAMQIRARTAETGGTPAEIEELDPAPPIVVGRRFNIIGSNFGAARGRVVLLMASLSDTGRPDILDCTLDRWGNELIQATIPELAEAWLDGAEKTGVIWVKQAGGETGPLMEARIAPDVSRIVPGITRLSTETIEPGAVLTITGEDFCASPDGTVTFSLLDCGRSFTGDVELWSDTAIRVVMPDDIEEVQPQRCRLEVTNHHGNKGERTLDFDPIWEVETLSASHSFDHTFLFSNFILMWFGETGTFTDHNITLINGWKVVRSYIDCSGSANHGCEHRTHPSEGDTRCASTIFIWCDAFGSVWCANCVEITGPKGFPYH
jgi:hypothetical protein